LTPKIEYVKKYFHLDQMFLLGPPPHSIQKKHMLIQMIQMKHMLIQKNQHFQQIQHFQKFQNHQFSQMKQQVQYYFENYLMKNLDM